MKQYPLRLLLITLASFLLHQNTQATPVRVSQMIGFTTGNLGTVGTSEGWAGGSINVTVTNGSGSLNGTSLGLFASAGDKAEVSTIVATNTQLTFATSGQFPQGTPINLYYSFLYRFNNVSAIGTATRMVAVHVQNSGSTAYWSLLAATNSSGQIQLGLHKPGGTAEFATTNLTVGGTFFVVIRQQIFAGGANDIMDLWINPPTDSFGNADENSLPTPSATTSSGTEPTSNTGPGRFYLLSGAQGSFDELRIATNSWADVTPPANSCVSAGFDSHPSDQTVSEGVAATFSVTSSSSSPTFKWQISTDGGSNWNDANAGTGTNTSSYTTPILTVADSGKMYRTIANVLCNGGSSATSSVASVTVNAAVSTPVGLVVDDNWSDFSRNDPPFATNNSIWFASSAPSLDASSGTMVGIPVSQSSRLWVGYFVDLTASLPVHLEMGRTLKATLVFTPTSFNQFTGNSGLRFGLFDYSDGGTRLSGDGFGSGSTGNGLNVRGYMLDQDFGTNFSLGLPMAILARNGLGDPNLMGSSGSFITLTNGPTGAALANAPAFAGGTNYTLEFSVNRLALNTTEVTARLTGGGSNWVTTVIDSRFAYPRFDSFAIRPNSLETTADSFNFTSFKVEVLQNSSPVSPFNITAIQLLPPEGIKLTWDSVSGKAYQVQSTDSLSPTVNWSTNATMTASSSSTSYTNSPVTSAQQFYRVVAIPE
ncbi:MAG: hypothetical protein H7Y43_09505 [Akkermansiaceae bacterium]|nr:hypothetical protein [Verrucomicrobiales bacterium]